MGYPYFETTASGNLPAGTDVAAALASGDEDALHAVWNTYHHNDFSRRALEKTTSDVARTGLQDDLAEHADITPVQALEANRRLVNLLTGRRWMVMRDAREVGDSWSTIGDALGISKQGAVDWYKRKIADQEKWIGDLHDADRARAVVAESSPEQEPRQ